MLQYLLPTCSRGSHERHHTARLAGGRHIIKELGSIRKNNIDVAESKSRVIRLGMGCGGVVQDVGRVNSLNHRHLESIAAALVLQRIGFGAVLHEKVGHLQLQLSNCDLAVHNRAANNSEQRQFNLRHDFVRMEIHEEEESKTKAGIDSHENAEICPRRLVDPNTLGNQHDLATIDLAKGATDRVGDALERIASGADANPAVDSVAVISEVVANGNIRGTSRLRNRSALLHPDPVPGHVIPRNEDAAKHGKNNKKCLRRHDSGSGVREEDRDQSKQ